MLEIRARDLPGIDCHARYLINPFVMGRAVGQVIIHARQEIARKLAHIIVENDKFFKITCPTKHEDLRIDGGCQVCTSEELAGALEVAYKKGQEDAMSSILI